MKNDLERLESQVGQLIKDNGLAEFKALPRGPDLAMIHWDTDQYPDPATFLEVAKHLGVKLICHSADMFTVDAIDEALETVRGAGLSREESRELDRELKKYKAYEGFLCDVELSFDFDGRIYCFNAQAPWYDEYMDLMDRVDELGEFDGDDDPGPGPGPLGYFSRN